MMLCNKMPHLGRIIVFVFINLFVAIAAGQIESEANLGQNSTIENPLAHH